MRISVDVMNGQISISEAMLLEIKNICKYWPNKLHAARHQLLVPARLFINRMLEVLHNTHRGKNSVN